MNRKVHRESRKDMRSPKKSINREKDFEKFGNCCLLKTRKGFFRRGEPSMFLLGTANAEAFKSSLAVSAGAPKCRDLPVPL
jgi:hypothetical protein